MSKLGAILGVLSIGRAFAETPLYKRFLSGIAVVICLTIITGMLAGALLIGLFYGVYAVLLAYGLASTPALITTFALALLTLIVLVMCTLSQLRGLMDVPNLLMSRQHPLASRATDIIQAFLDGFNGTAAPTEKPSRSRWF